MSKFTKPVLHPPASPAKIEREIASRHRRDGVKTLEDGFHFRPSGRDGFIYYREGPRLLELYWEMSGDEAYDILLSLDGLRRWRLPAEEDLAEAKRRNLETCLREWLTSRNLRARMS